MQKFANLYLWLTYKSDSDRFINEPFRAIFKPNFQRITEKNDTLSKEWHIYKSVISIMYVVCIYNNNVCTKVMQQKCSIAKFLKMKNICTQVVIFY